MKRLLCLAAVAALVTPSLGQITPSEVAGVSEKGDDAPQIVHVTDVLNRRPEAIAALAEYHALKAAGQLPLPGKTQFVADVGDTVSFRVYDLSDQIWSNEDFILTVESGVARVWVSVFESDGPGGNGHVTAEMAQEISDALAFTTPTRSYNPNQGIVANNIEVFGTPPDPDGDGKTDFLLYDIIDGRSGGEYVAGFFFAADLSPTGPGNGRDVLYIDSNEGLANRPVENALATTAHEHQHLIHFGSDTNEQSFVNEGLSEWAELVNGYPGRTMSYLSQLVEQNRTLFYWDGRLIDYQRAGLFTNYLSERTSTLATGSIVADVQNGGAGYRNMLQTFGLTLDDVVIDFHTANLINGLGVSTEPRFNFQEVTYAAVNATVSPRYRVDGRSRSSTSRSDTVRSGAVVYHVWDDVEDFRFIAEPVELPGQTADRRAAWSHLRAIVERPGQSAEIMDLPDLVDMTFDGVLDRFSLLIVHTSPEPFGPGTDPPIAYDYSASWSGGGQSVENTVYDSGSSSSFLLTEEAYLVSTRFDILEPARTTLDVASLAIYYYNEFNGGPPDDSPRDFRLHIWADDNGQPGAELYTQDITDPRPTSDVTTNDLRFLDIDLGGIQIGDLPPSIHIGYSNIGTDANYIVMGNANYATENVSHVSLGADWVRHWDITLSGGGDLNGQFAAMRLQVLVGPEIVSTEDEPELPTRIGLAQNYPNPFNPSTTIRYQLPNAADVRLVVYDVLGREIAELVNETVPSGRHEVELDATGWPSGLYVYSLSAGDTRLTRNMVLLR